MTAPAPRLFTDDELDALAEGPEERVRRALATMEPAGAMNVVAEVEAGVRSVIVGMGIWAGIAQGWLAGHRPRSTSAGGAQVEVAWRIAVLHHIGPGDLDLLASKTTPWKPAPEAGGALARFSERLAAYRRLHDASVDWVSALLSMVYRAAGPDGLEDCLRIMGEKTLLRWMAEDLVTEPKTRLVRWASLLTSNFAVLAIQELDDRFVIRQDPCGTCTRQIRWGAYEQPLDLAVVVEPHLVTYGLGDLGVYRCHIAVIHHAMATEQTGRPWPIHHCPAHLGTEPCVIELLKEPLASG